jgi:hypothetical protein
MSRVFPKQSPTQPPPLLPELWPLTGAYAFLDADIADVVETLTAWRRGLGRDPQSEEVNGSLSGLLQRLQPMSLGYRELLLRTESPWTAYFADHRTGADEAPVGQLARFLRCRALYLIRWPVPGFEALRFQLIADHETDFLNYERTIEVGTGDNGRKVFTAVGRVQPYEQLEAYRARRVSDRLTPAMVDEYSRELGLRPFDLGIFAPDGVLVTSRDDRPDLRFPIADQQARYRYVPPTS